MRRLLPLPVLLIACLLLPGCAGPRTSPASSPVASTPSAEGGHEPRTTPEPLPTPEGVGDTPAPGSSIPIPASSDADGSAGGEVDPAPFTTEAGMLTHLDFDSPDRNLHCGIRDTSDSGSYYGCVLEHRTYREPAKGSCQQAFGKGFVAPFAGRPHAACRGDVLFDGETRRVPVLPSGASLSYGAITCSVSGNTVTCGNQRGDGFIVSADRYVLRG